MRHWWKDTDKRKSTYVVRNLSATLFTINPTWTELESSPGLGCDRTGLANSLNRGMAKEITIQSENFQRGFIWSRTRSDGGALVYTVTKILAP